MQSFESNLFTAEEKMFSSSGEKKSQQEPMPTGVSSPTNAWYMQLVVALGGFANAKRFLEGELVLISENELRAYCSTHGIEAPTHLMILAKR